MRVEEIFTTALDRNHLTGPFADTSTSETLQRAMDADVDANSASGLFDRLDDGSYMAREGANMLFGFMPPCMFFFAENFIYVFVISWQRSLFEHD